MYHTMHLKQQLKLSTVQDTLYQKNRRGGGGGGGVELNNLKNSKK